MKFLHPVRASACAALLACLESAFGQEPPLFLNRITYSFEPYITVPFSGPADEEATHYLTCAMFYEHFGPDASSYNVFGALEQITVAGHGATAWHVSQYAVFHGENYLHLNALELKWTPGTTGNYTLTGLTLGLGGNEALPNPPGLFNRETTLEFRAY